MYLQQQAKRNSDWSKMPTDAWDLSSGLVDNFDGTVTDAWFTFDDSYNNGETCVLKLEVKADNPGTFPNENTTTILYPLGKGWDIADKGVKCAHESGKQQQFHKNSGMGLLINAAREIGLVDKWREQDATPFDARIWIGVHCEWHNTEFTFTTKEGEERSYYRMLPCALLDSTDNQNEDTPQFDLSPALRGKLRAIATNCDTHDKFIEQAFTADLDLGPEGEAAVLSTKFYASLRQG